MTKTGKAASQPLFYIMGSNNPDTANYSFSPT